MFPQIYFLGWGGGGGGVGVLLHPAFLTGVMSCGTNLNSSLAAQTWAAFIFLLSLSSQNGHK